MSEKERYIHTATKGLIRFRQGETQQGRLLYDLAVNGFKNIHDRLSESMAIFWWATEEKRINSPLVKKLKTELKELIDRYNFDQVNDLYKKI